MPLALVMLVVGIGLLVVGADWLIDGAKGIAKRLGVSPFMIGLTVLAFGTSAPELAACVGLVLDGQSATAVGAVVGSNIANVALILGFTAAVYGVPVRGRAPGRDALIMLGATLFAVVFLNDGVVRRWEAALLLVGLALYITRAYISGRRVSAAMGDDEAESPRQPIAMQIGLVLLGAAGLAGGAHLLVRGASEVALQLGVPEFVVGLTLVAFGTSLPELVTTLRAASRKESELALGNVLGSNVFNLFAVLGVSGLIGALETPIGVRSRDQWIMLGLAVATIPMLRRGRKITRVEGLILVIGYLVYVGVLYATA